MTLVPRGALSHASELPPAVLLAALRRRVRADAHRRPFSRADLLTGAVEESDVWLRPVVSRWENPVFELAGAVQPRGAGSVLRGELRIPGRSYRVVMGFLLLGGVALGIGVGVGESAADGLLAAGVMSVAPRLLLQLFLVRERSEILRVVRVAEADAIQAQAEGTPLPR